MKLGFVILAVALVTAAGCNKERIHDGRDGKTICPVHGVRMQEGIVPIAYGTPARDDWHVAYNKAWFTTFPYSFMWYGGGCVSDEFGEKARVLYCPKCRETEAAWLREHPNKKG